MTDPFQTLQPLGQLGALINGGVWFVFDGVRLYLKREELAAGERGAVGDAIILVGDLAGLVIPAVGGARVEGWSGQLSGAINLTGTVWAGRRVQLATAAKFVPHGPIGETLAEAVDVGVGFLTPPESSPEYGRRSVPSSGVWLRYSPPR